jgi:hypothetical protein
MYFKTFLEVASFIEYAQDLWEWGCRLFRLSNTTGAVLDIDTTNYATANTSGYVRFGSLINYLNTYYEQCNGQAFTMEIKLVCPESFRAECDPNHYYDSFFITFYSSNNNHYINLGYNENGVNLQTSPYLAYVGYIQGLFDNWKTYYTNNFQ